MEPVEKEDPANPDQAHEYALEYSTLHRTTRATKKTRKDDKTRKRNKNSGKGRLQPRGSGSAGSNSAGSSRLSSSSRSSRRDSRRGSVKSLKKEIRNINTRAETHEFWPWHIHITAYSSDVPTECSGMLLG